MADAAFSPDGNSSTYWLLSAYRADSHAAWADWLVRAFPEIRWRRLELPGRHFAWRIRGAPLSWLDTLPDETPDAIVATSMVDLATLKGLHPRLGRVPALYFFHENQFAYPRGDAQTTSVEAQMVQIYGALAADRVRFNSSFNRDTFLSGVETLMQRLPDHVPTGIAERLRAGSAVLPVPIEPPSRPTAAEPRDPNLIVWNHRWEYDKAPELFVHVIEEMANEGEDFRLALLGQRPPGGSPELNRLRDSCGDRIAIDGMLSRDEYWRWLHRAGIAVSTARHEFQGLAMLEATCAGCQPLVPDALCYPEIYPEAYRYAADDTQALKTRLRDWLRGVPQATPGVDQWTGSALLPEWRSTLGALHAPQNH